MAADYMPLASCSAGFESFQGKQEETILATLSGV